MTIEAPVYEAHPYESGFEPANLNVPEAVRDIRFVGLRNFVVGAVWTTAFTAAGIAGGNTLDQYSDDKYNDALAEANIERDGDIAQAEDYVAISMATVKELEVRFDEAPDCLVLIRNSLEETPDDNFETAVVLAEVSDTTRNNGVCGYDSPASDILIWVNDVKTTDNWLSMEIVSLEDLQESTVQDYVDQSAKDRAWGDPLTVLLGIVGLNIGLATLPISSEDSIARARIKRNLKKHLDPKTYLTERSPVATHRKLKEDAAWALRDYKNTQPEEQERYFAPNRKERRARAKQTAKNQ
ncbi:MAG TPA: hypothetical protein PKB09_02270 [Candidatus Saccharibacteria bacterium]|nr:hypothetical protein [Candidatus Saccharibacteria bacterium]